MFFSTLIEKFKVTGREAFVKDEKRAGKIKKEKSVTAYPAIKPIFLSE